MGDESQSDVSQLFRLIHEDPTDPLVGDCLDEHPVCLPDDDGPVGVPPLTPSVAFSALALDVPLCSAS